jgi:hypothetical protein
MWGEIVLHWDCKRIRKYREYSAKMGKFKAPSSECRGYVDIEFYVYIINAKSKKTKNKMIKWSCNGYHSYHVLFENEFIQRVSLVPPPLRSCKFNIASLCFSPFGLVNI